MHASRIPERVEKHLLLFFAPSQIIQFKQVNKRYSKMVSQLIWNQERFCKIYKINIEQLQDLFRANYHKMPMKMLAVCIEDYMLKVAIIDRMRTLFHVIMKQRTDASRANYENQQYPALCCRRLIVMNVVNADYWFIPNPPTINSERLYCHGCLENHSIRQVLIDYGFTDMRIKSIPSFVSSRFIPSQGCAVRIVCFPNKFVDIAEEVGKAAFDDKRLPKSSADAGAGAGSGASESRPTKRQKIQ